MNPYPTTLVCTVGTSLFQPNLQGLDPETKYMTEPEESGGMGKAEKGVLQKAGLWEDKTALKRLLKNIKTDFEAARWADLAGQLTMVPPDLRLCGADRKGIKKTRFHERAGGVFGEYVDRNRFGGRFEIMTRAENRLERAWVLGKLNAWAEGRSLKS